jgi:hypothetical protein
LARGQKAAAGEAQTVMDYAQKLKTIEAKVEGRMVLG